MKVIPAVGTIFLASLAQAAYGYNSIIPKDGYDIDRKLIMRQGSDASFNIARTDHFIVKTTLANPAAQDISRHLEIWHSQIVTVLPRATEIFTEKKDQRVTIMIFATREHKAAYYGNKDPQKMGIDTNGVFCDKKDNGKYVFSITALQHECFHFWNDIFMGKSEPMVWEEGGSDYFGVWDIDKSIAYNLSGVEYEPGWVQAEGYRTGKIPFITVQQMMKGEIPKGCQYYFQGWMLFNFLVVSPVGKKHAEIMFTAYETDSRAPKLQKAQREYYRVNGDIVIFNEAYLRIFERDWKDYIKTFKKPDNQAQ